MADIVLDHMSKRFADGTLAVNDVSLRIGDGEFVILVGPSGCGKSTCLNMIAGLEDITSGELRIGGRVVNDLAPKDRDIAMVFQNYALYPHMTVRDNMAFSLKLAKVDRAKVDRTVTEAAQLLELTALLDRTFSADVEVLESLGAEKYAYLPLQGARATARELEELAAETGATDVPGGAEQVVARLDAASKATEGRPLELWFDPRKLHLFNPDTGAHLTL